MRSSTSSEHIDGDLRDGQRLLVSPQVDEAQGQLAGALGRLGVQAHAGHGRGLDVATVRGVFADDLEGFKDGQGRAVVTPGEGLINVGEGGRRHGAYDTAPNPTEVTSSTKHGRISERVLSVSPLTCHNSKTLHP